MWAYIEAKIEQPHSQRKLVLVIVSIVLLLDNMLYMVIVPIIPHFLRNTSTEFHSKEYYWANHTHNFTNHLMNRSEIRTNRTLVFKLVVLESFDSKIGLLFASKAIVQLLVNPITGHIIDRVGYDRPMMVGLIIMFLSTTVFAFGTSYNIMFLARSLQGLGSAFADTSGLAMIADRFTEESERTKALGIAIAFISFGSLVAPPFGGILYENFNKELPFMILALLALLDGVLLMIVMRPVRIERRTQKAIGELPKGTPMWRLLMDPFIAVTAGALAMANVSLAFLEPTISDWMLTNLHSSNTEMGLVWLPAFIPHVFGVWSTVYLAKRYPKYQWLMAAVGLALEGISCIFIPFCKSFIALMFPICILCYGIALIDTALLPTLGYVVDTRHVSIYGSVYAIADISYSLAYALGPVVAGNLVSSIGFLGLNIFIFLTNILYAPVLIYLKNVYKYDNFPDGEDFPKESVTLNGEGNLPPKPQYRTYMINGSEGTKQVPLDSKTPDRGMVTEGLEEYPEKAVPLQVHTDHRITGHQKYGLLLLDRDQLQSIRISLQDPQDLQWARRHKDIQHRLGYPTSTLTKMITSYHILCT